MTRQSLDCRSLQLWTHINKPQAPRGAFVGMKNIIRGAGLSVFVTFLGCFLAFTAPDLVAAQLGKTLPYWFYESEVTFHDLACNSF